MSYISLSKFITLFENNVSGQKIALMESTLTESVADVTKVNTIALVTKTALNTKRVTPGNLSTFLARRLADAGLNLNDNVAGTTNTVADYIHAKGVVPSMLSQAEKDSIRISYGPNLVINDLATPAEEMPATEVTTPTYTSATNALQAKADAASAEGVKIAQGATGKVSASALQQSLPAAPTASADVTLPNVTVSGSAPAKHTSAFYNLAEKANRVSTNALAGVESDLRKTGVTGNANATALAAANNRKAGV